MKRKDRIEKEWARAIKHWPEQFIIYNEKTGRPTFFYRHPNLLFGITVTAILLVLLKPVLLGMLQWL